MTTSTNTVEEAVINGQIRMVKELLKVGNLLPRKDREKLEVLKESVYSGEVKLLPKEEYMHLFDLHEKYCGSVRASLLRAGQFQRPTNTQSSSSDKRK